MAIQYNIFDNLDGLEAVKPDNKELTRLKNTLHYWRLSKSDSDFEIGNTFSDIFKTGNSKEFTWESSLIKTLKDYKFYLTLRKSNVFEIKVNCKILVNQSQAPVDKPYSKTYTFRKNDEQPLFSVAHKDLSSISGLGFEITPEGLEKNSEEQLSGDTDNALNNFKKLFEDKEFSDVTFVTPRGTIQAHKAILAVRSSVFAKMFTENPGNEFQVQYNHDAFEALLSFLYTGTANVSDRYVIETLLELSKKHGLDDLKTICMGFLYNALTFDNVLATLELCEVHNMMELKQKAIEFAAANAKDIIHSEKYREFMKSHVNTAVAIARSVVVSERRDADDNSAED